MTKSNKPKKYRTPALQSLHEIAKDLHAVGAIDDAKMREFDAACLTPIKPTKPRKDKK